MAHHISYKPTGIILSSAIGDVAIFVDGSYVDVRLTGMGGVTVLSERYYAYGGLVTLYDLASLIEAEMRKSSTAVQDFTLSVFSDTPSNKADSCVLTVLYCDRFTVNTDLDIFLKENFLTTLAMRRVAPDDSISLFFYAEEGESVAATVNYSFRAVERTEIFTHSLTLDAGKTVASSGVVQVNLSVDTIVSSAASFMTLPKSDVTPLAFTVHCGQRSLSFFIDSSLRNLDSFLFRNCFNVYDFANFPAVTTAKTDVDRTIAVINHRSGFYDQQTTKTYEVETGPLTSDEAEWIDQLFTSYDVFRIERDDTNIEDPLMIVPVIITDSTCEIHDGDDKLNKVKFTWRYAENRPIVRFRISSGIFTSPYNIVYS